MKTDTTEDLTIIGIGSSAGGLEAIRELVSTLPAKIPVSYVVVQHMSPHHKSLMTELVSRQTELMVKDVSDGTKPEPNVIYVTPPKTDVIFAEGLLRLVDPGNHPASPKPSVDRFLSSLAAEHGEKTIAIILSGTGSDGAYGVQVIREAGGITIAQDEESAKYDGMPKSAIQTGCVDLILRPVDIGTHLQKILTSPRDFAEFRKGELQETPLTDLLHILLARTRVDFRDYKQTTIGRRIERRMVALGIESQEEYTQFCRNNPHAVDALFKDLLISVTRFFRDKEAFAKLQQLLPQLIKDSGPGPFRIWVAGCATGEEAYSIAMLMSEALGEQTVPLKSLVQIFATDIDKNALQVARNAVYATSALNDIPAHLAEKYLINQNDSVRVIDSIRNTVLFSDHNICQDPPFQKLDLVCCRNLLIYFGNSLQQKVMSRFHYAMKPHGVMFLGSAESVAGSDELFVPQRDALQVFRKRVLHKGSHISYNMPNVPAIAMRSAEKNTPERAPSTDRQLFEALAQSLGENSLLVTEDYAIARVYGNISAYIEVSANSGLKMHLDLLRSPLREEARSLITIAIKNETHRAGVRHLLAKDDAQEVRLDVYPIVAKDINERAALVVFTPIKRDKPLTQNENEHVSQVDGNAISERIRTLENEVETTREALQQTIEELETSNEELQSLNEELQSTNEELQATNEELETSNEELQSTNEELITVNEELQVTASELTGRTGELTSVLQSTPLAILVTDGALQVTQATAAASKLFGIKQPITNPHISQCILPNGYPSLAPICSEALKLGETSVQEFTAGGTRVRLSCSPYFDLNGQILGLTMVVTEFPGLAREMEMILDNAHVFMMNRSNTGEILRISNQSATALGTTRQAAKGRNLTDIFAPEEAAQIHKEDLKVLNNNKHELMGMVQFARKDTGQPMWLSVDRFPYSEHPDAEPSVFTIGTDVTAEVLARNEAQQFVTQLELLQDLAQIGYWSYDLEKEALHWSKEVFRIHDVPIEQGTPDIETAIKFYHPDDIEDVKAIVGNVIEHGGEFEFAKRLKLKDGSVIKVQSHGLAVANDLGEVVKVAGVFKQL